MFSNISQGVLRSCLFLWGDFCRREVFSFVWGTLLLFFLHLRLFDNVRFQYSHGFVIFLFSKRSDSFLIWQFNSFRYLSFSTFHYEHDTSFYAKFHSYIIIIIIMSCRQHGYPWRFLATPSYHSSPPAGLQGYILCPHIVAVCKFELVVLLLHGHMWGSIGVHHLWACPCFSSSVPRVWFV